MPLYAPPAKPENKHNAWLAAGTIIGGLGITLIGVGAARDSAALNAVTFVGVGALVVGLVVLIGVGKEWLPGLRKKP